MEIAFGIWILGIKWFTARTNCGKVLFVTNRGLQGFKFSQHIWLMITPAEALQRLKEGNQRFVSGARQALDLSDSARLAEVASGQNPFAAILCCADSRVPSELIFDQGLGDLFVVRVAGNVAEDTQVGSLEFAVEQLGAQLIVVMGHSHCGAVNAALAGAVGLSPSLSKVVAPISRAIDSMPKTDSTPTLEQAVEANVHQSIEDLKRKSEILAQRLDEGAIEILGSKYDLQTGLVQFLD